MKKFSIPIIFIVLGFLGACSDSGGGSNSTANDVSLQKLSDADYQGLSDEEKYAVSNKLLSALFKGVSADEFFDFSEGIPHQVSKIDGNYIAGVERDLSKPLHNEDQILNKIDDKYEFDTKALSLQYPLAMLFEYPLSLEFYEIWMAYKLVNTILFSPAVELETTDYTDAQDIFYRLVNMMGEGSGIRDIVYEHMISQENWRRFRSPEDNTREMMEIFLNRFIDSEVPLAAQACKNWSLTDESQGYQLVIGFDENTEPVEILDTTVVDCFDFFQSVANHQALIPTITADIVDVFFNGYSDEKKAHITDAIMASNPVTFEDIFSTIIFSKEYLLNAERPKRFEETFLNLAHRIQWYAPSNFFKSINPQWSGSSYPHLKNMKQAAMTYKLGRPDYVPLDTLSFSYYHKAIREKLLIDRKADPFNDQDGGWQQEFIDTAMMGDEFIDFLFLSVLGRTAQQREMDELIEIIGARGYGDESEQMQQAMIIMDYFSRLPELYYTRSFE